jgi:TolB-like protein/DNA-binding winged helix-turn-helix (wHTH) protein
MSNEINNFYEFGAYRLDPMRKVLLRDGAAVALTSKAFETLLVLVQHSEQVVSKDELMKTLWPDTFVEEANLTQHISMVRRALGETPQDRRYILTLPSRGYSFAGTVRVVPQERNHPVVDIDRDTELAVPETPISNPPTGIGDKEGTQVAFRHKPVTWAALASAGLAIIAGVVLWLSHHSGGREETAAGGPVQKRTMLTVLPFQNLSNDPDQDYFSDGLTEETITDLGELNPQQLGLIARTSSTAYKHTNKTIAQIGRELGVDYVLEGSVRREGGVVRISAQLIRVNDQVHLWAHNYDRETGGLLAVENELGRAIAQQVQVKLRQPNGDRPAYKYAMKPEAYKLYLKGRFYLNKRTWPEIDKSTVFSGGDRERSSLCLGVRRTCCFLSRERDFV